MRFTVIIASRPSMSSNFVRVTWRRSGFCTRPVPRSRSYHIISTIRSWALSTVSTSDGAKDFTHVWEQEFDAIEGLTGEYMDHPIHWGIVDSFFDAELPQYIVDPFLLQVVGKIERPIIT